MKLFKYSLLFLTFAGFAQEDVPLGKITNAEESNYRFTEVKHLDAMPVQNQGSSGTCWSFSGLSFFESEMIRLGKKPVLLSEMYVARKAYEKKAELYVRFDGKTNFGEGGEFHDLPAIISEFGIVPQESYTGLNYGLENHDHSELYSVLKGAMDGLLAYMKSNGFDGLSTAWKPAINGVLDAYFGKDIQKFSFQGQEYTPKTYAAATGLDMKNYVSVTSFTHQPYNLPFALEIPDNWSHQVAYNVKLDEMYNTAVQALKNGYTIGWTADVSEAGFSHRKGLAINPVDEELLQAKENNAFFNPTEEVNVTAELRQKGYDNKTTQDDHLMHIVGLYTDQKGTTYFLVKNSWGTTNYPEGYLYVSESYFKAKTIYIYLHKDGLDKNLKKQIGLN